MEKITKMVSCDRCGGHGVYFVAVHNGQGVPAQPADGVCYKCGGSGKMEVTEVIRNEKEQAAYEKARAARLARAAAKQEAERAERERLSAEREAAEQARAEAAEAERVANLRHGYVGDIGEKINTEAVSLYMATFEVKSFSGYGTETMRVYSFETSDRKMIVWKTSSYIPAFEKGKSYLVAGTVKEYTNYRGNDQTILTRVKAIAQ